MSTRVGSWEGTLVTTPSIVVPHARGLRPASSVTMRALRAAGLSSITTAEGEGDVGAAEGAFELDGTSDGEGVVRAGFGGGSVPAGAGDEAVHPAKRTIATPARSTLKA